MYINPCREVALQPCESTMGPGRGVAATRSAERPRRPPTTERLRECELDDQMSRAECRDARTVGRRRRVRRTLGASAELRGCIRDKKRRQGRGWLGSTIPQWRRGRCGALALSVQRRAAGTGPIVARLGGYAAVRLGARLVRWECAARVGHDGGGEACSLEHAQRVRTEADHPLRKEQQDDQPC